MNTEHIARIIAVHKERYALWDEEHGEYYGKLKASNYYHLSLTPYPVTGDLVKCQYNTMGDSVVLETLPRKTFIQRFDAWNATNAQAIAANVDEIFILTSANHDFNLKRLHRYLAACKQGRANCTIVITKADVCEHPEELLEKAKKEGAAITDDCSAVERLGMSVKIVEGDERNIKVTTPMDLKIAEMLLEDEK